MAFGEIEDIEEGTIFNDRRALSIAGIHRPLQAGICGPAQLGAESIVLSGGYIDDEDHGDIIIYTGHGGNDPSTNRQVTDQTFTRQNEALRTSCNNSIPVRVIRGSKHDSPASPDKGYMYCGLYIVQEFWKEKGRDGFQICRFKLKKIKDKNKNNRNLDGQETNIDTIQFDNGDFYIGETSNNLPNGMGKFIWADGGDEYYGDFINGERRGLGFFINSNRDEIIGEFRKDKLYGNGMYNWKNGYQYIGKFKNGLFNGLGYLTNQEGKYIGEFKEDLRHGKGRITYSDNSIQEGNWENGKLVKENHLKSIFTNISNKIYGSLDQFEFMRLSNDVKNQTATIKKLCKKIEQKKINLEEKIKFLKKNNTKKQTHEQFLNSQAEEWYFQFEKFEDIKFLTERFESKWKKGELKPYKLRVENEQLGRFINHGLPVTYQEMDELLKMYIEEKSFKEMVTYFQRTEFAIKKRLEILGIPEDKLN